MINIKWHDFFKVRPKKEKEILLRLYNSFYIGWLNEDNILCTQEFSLDDEEIEDELRSCYYDYPMTYSEFKDYRDCYEVDINNFTTKNNYKYTIIC